MGLGGADPSIYEEGPRPTSLGQKDLCYVEHLVLSKNVNMSEVSYIPQFRIFFETINPSWFSELYFPKYRFPGISKRIIKLTETSASSIIKLQRKNSFS